MPEKRQIVCREVVRSVALAPPAAPMIAVSVSWDDLNSDTPLRAHIEPVIAVESVALDLYTRRGAPGQELPSPDPADILRDGWHYRGPEVRTRVLRLTRDENEHHIEPHDDEPCDNEVRVIGLAADRDELVEMAQAQARKEIARQASAAQAGRLKPGAPAMHGATPGDDGPPDRPRAA